MEEKEPEAEDGMLRWIAGVMGFKLHHESEYDRNGIYEADRWWFMSKPFPRGYTDKLCPGVEDDYVFLHAEKTPE